MASRRRKPPDSFDPEELFRTLAEGITSHAVKPNLLAYEPHSKQEIFHSSTDHNRMYVGGNRSGKTYSAVAEDLFWLRKEHPFRRLELPEGKIRGRLVAVDFDRGVDQIILPVLKSLIYPSMLRNGSWEDSYHASKHLLTLANGSTLEFMSYEQDVEKFAGTSRHFIHYDEEPPRAIYNECQARLVDTNGSSWISMTPVEGATWLFDEIYEPANEAPDKEVVIEGNFEIAPVFRTPSKNITVIEVGMNENPHLKAEARERFLATLDEDERAARSKGTFVTMGGKVFKNFAVQTHVTDAHIDPAQLQADGWQIYTSVDHGWNAPTAWYWHAVAPEHMGGQVITFSEHYKSEMIIEDHAKEVLLREQAWGLNQEEIIRTGDPAMHQHNGVTGTTVIQEYAKSGVYIYTDSVPKDRHIGIARMQSYFKIRPNGKPLWQISDACPELIKELRKLRWKTYTSKKMQMENNPQEQIHKKDDHGFDSCKYFATFLSELAPEVENNYDFGLPKDRSRLSYDEALLQQAESEGIKWEVVESF